MKVDTCDTVGRHARQKHSRDLSTLRQDRNLEKFRVSGQRTFRLKLFFHVQAHQANLVCEEADWCALGSAFIASDFC